MKNVILIISALVIIACSNGKKERQMGPHPNTLWYYMIFNPSDWSWDSATVELISSFLFERRFIYDQMLLDIANYPNNALLRNMEEEFYITVAEIPDKVLLPVDSKLNYDISTEYGYPIHGQDSVDINYLMNRADNRSLSDTGACKYLGRILFYDDINSIVISRSMGGEPGTADYYAETFLFNTTVDGRVISVLKLTGSGANSRQAAIRPGHEILSQNDVLLIRDEADHNVELGLSKRKERRLSKTGELNNRVEFCAYKILPSGQIQKKVVEWM